MGARSAWSRILSLESITGAPFHSREFLQRRIGTFFGTIAFIGWTVFCIAAIVTLLGHTPAGGMKTPMRAVHLGVNVVTLAIFLACRRGERSLSTLNLLDGVGTLGLNASLVLQLLLRERAGSPEIDMLVAFVIALMARAAIVPSEPSRTLALGLASAAMYIAGAVVVVRSGPRPPASLPFPIIMVTVWSLLAVTLTVLVSREIYGLHKKIEKARQLGQYTLESKIGEGGMGIVYRASHAMLRRPTAIKLLPPERMGDAALARFEREVQATAQLTHPNTVAIYDYGRTPDGLFYYAMEYLDGLDVQTVVDIDGPQPEGRVVHVLRQAAGALAEAHGAGLVHRDVKPANLILCERGGVRDVVKVLDFGLVKSIERTDKMVSSETTLVGTPLYMAPEAVSSPELLDARGDVYALGAVGYWMLTGAPPFDGKSAVEILARALHEPPIPPSARLDRSLDRELEELVMSCLEKQPARRPASAAELAARLDVLSTTHPWTPAEAERWWSSRAHRAPARKAADAALAAATTVVVDLEARERASA